MNVKKLFLNLYIWPAMLIVSAISIAVVLPLGLLILPFITSKSNSQIIRNGIRIYGWMLVRILPFMAPVTVEDRSGGFTTPVIFTANHNSSVDPYLFGMLPFENAFVTTWPFKIPFYNVVMKIAQYIDANRGWDHVETQGLELLDSGCSLILWPEGHRSRDGKLARFRNGAFHLALKSGRPIVPVCILGSFKLLPPGSRLLTPSRVKMVLLPPIIPSGSAENNEDVKKLKNRVKDSIAAEQDRQQLFTPEPAKAAGRFADYSTHRSTAGTNG
ncbi:MAG: 1-acyl-sn-glycerol-3-phosphate acyltransferase [Proteobacteria bacterium]|nr:1-acyl-sn-glycerol-3-phosphate acyltransferase [Pseudomonadota bacterium]MBU1710655.1 1-acyl-sn-glycerol-3-phosphate acyltransferase [Pseudomonadota bacterium]